MADEDTRDSTYLEEVGEVRYKKPPATLERSDEAVDEGRPLRTASERGAAEADVDDAEGHHWRWWRA